MEDDEEAADPTHPQYQSGYQAGLAKRKTQQAPEAQPPSALGSLPRTTPRPVLGTQLSPLSVTPTSVYPEDDDERSLPRRRRSRPLVAPFSVPSGPAPANFGRVQ